MTRRQFLCSAGLAALAPFSMRAGEQGQKLRAAIIGHTGHGNYGHEHDVIFNGRENIQVVAVADPDDQGRAKAAARSHALHQYADYHEMLENERPHLVCVAPRWTDEHHAMALTALRVGAHVYLEKPITQSLAEADELLSTAKRSGLKIVVAHQMRLAPNILFLKTAIEKGLVGELLEIRAVGKQDTRAGGEDLIVLCRNEGFGNGDGCIRGWTGEGEGRVSAEEPAAPIEKMISRFADWASKPCPRAPGFMPPLMPVPPPTFLGDI